MHTYKHVITRLWMVLSLSACVVPAGFALEQSAQPSAHEWESALKKSGKPITDVAATRRALARQDGGTILVGHSWGGVVITEAGVDDKVKGLVYVSALTADVGETAGDQYEGFGIPSTFVVEEQADGFGFISADRFKEGFAADVGDADVAFMRDSQVPIAMSSFATPVTQAAWRTRPSWFIVATEDAAIAPAMLRQQAEKIGAVKVEIRASHVPMISQPHAVADVIDQAARSAGPRAN